MELFRAPTCVTGGFGARLAHCIATSQDLGPQKGSFLEGKWDPCYFREIQVGEILFHLARLMVGRVDILYFPIYSFVLKITLG